jgi:transposase-like protein
MTQEERAERVRRKGEQYWHFDAIDEKTRFLVGLHVSRDRDFEDTVAFFKDCAYNNTPRPQAIITDDMNAYLKAFNKVFWNSNINKKVRHLHTHGFGARMNNQPIERWHSTLKDRLRPMRGLVSPDTQVLRGFAVHYNFLRPHESLGGATPARVAQINLPFEDGWGDLIGWATKWQTLSQTDAKYQNKLN